ncbi:ABC transporter permease [Desulfosarcina sp. OttesenSCG-928-A07]|nr:ABC transporter permease [Desulfosarcina sp. OttesenSCG-928-G17]MDL2329626.1 ABC transporter permease [Desulfosarcina sp. OttesenSCG-928-A07]
MSRESTFSFTRWWGVVVKEFLQLKRDPVTFVMILIMPVMQLLLFGYAMNTDPKNLPTALIIGEQSQFTRRIEASLRNSDYFAITKTLDENTARHALAKGEVQFVVSIPVDFSRRLVRGERPAILIEADATDPMTIGGALSALQGIVESVAEKELTGALGHVRGTSEALSIQVHRMYNPEGLTHYNVVPGLMGVILALTTVMMTGLSITKERERGTMENLLALPVSPMEIMMGKIVPYIFIGHFQAGVIILLTRLLFRVPFVGNPFALYVATVLFIASNLMLGVTLSSFTKNQLQAMQLTMFYFLPNMMLSGFTFPFAGMPKWAQVIGNIFPLTHFNRSVRGVLLKGNDWGDLWPHLWPVALFCVVVMALSVLFFRRTLD